MAGAMVKPGVRATLTCDILGYPSATVTWSYVPCEKYAFDHRSCDNNKKVQFTVPFRFHNAN